MKKKVEVNAITVTADMRQRAWQHLADCLIEIANSLGSNAQMRATERMKFGLPANTAHAIGEVEAQMAIWLAKEMAQGKLVPGTV